MRVEGFAESASPEHEMRRAADFERHDAVCHELGRGNLGALDIAPPPPYRAVHQADGNGYRDVHLTDSKH